MSVTVYQPDQIAQWYRPTTSATATAHDAYKQAIDHFERELAGRDSERAWIRGFTTVEEVQKEVLTAQAKYDKATEKHAKARKCIEAFASTLKTYGAVLDVLSAADPLHAGLVWGAIKFVFCGVSQHAQLVSELTEALALIGEVLPRIEVNMAMYSTSRMQDAVSKVYAYVLLFLQRAISWYNASPPRRAFRSIFGPLAFKDVVSQIKSCVDGVEVLAGTAQRAEIRGQSVALELMQRQMQQIQTTVAEILQVSINNRDLIGSVKLDTGDSLTRIREFQLSKMLDILKPDVLPEQALQQLESSPGRRSSWSSHPRDSRFIADQLQKWAATPGSASVTVRAPPSASSRVGDMILEVTKFLQASQLPTFWYLSAASFGRDRVTPFDVIKSLLHQIIRRDPSICSREPRLGNALTYQMSHTLTDWVDLFGLALAEIKQCFLIVEAEASFRSSAESNALVRELHHSLDTIFTQVSDSGAVVKMLVVTTGVCSPSFQSIRATHLAVTMSAPLPAARRSGRGSKIGPVLGRGPRHFRPALLAT